MKMVMVVVKWASSYNDDGDEEILFAVPIQWQCDNDNNKNHNDVGDGEKQILSAAPATDSSIVRKSKGVRELVAETGKC